MRPRWLLLDLLCFPLVLVKLAVNIHILKH
jgi:hypothetical protein